MLKTKNPEVKYDLRDECKFAVPPRLPSQWENLSRTSNKVPAGNGATGSHYWQNAFTRPTQEPDRQTLSHRLTPTAGSLELFGERQVFHQSLLHVLYQIKPQTAPEVNMTDFTKIQTLRENVLDRKTFDFSWRTWYSICNIEKRL